MKLKRIMKDGIIYDWSKLMLTFDYLTPNPNLHYVTDNIRLMNEQNVEGMYFQIQNNLGTDFYDLRNYLLAKGAWRPETDNRKAMEEFCRLFYQEGGRRQHAGSLCGAHHRGSEVDQIEVAP